MITKDQVIKVQFICKNRIDSYGISYGLLNSAKFVLNALQNQKCYCSNDKIEGEVVSVLDGNGIDREVQRYKPNFVSIQALWVTPDKMGVLLEKYPKIKFVVRIHSKIPFLANEGIAFDWINGYKLLTKKYNNLYLSGNSRTFHDDINETIGIRSVYLPNIYAPEESDESDESDKITCNNEKDKNIINIGCFGALRPMKNHMNQAVAAVRFADKINKKLRFHINGTRIEQRGDSVLKNLRAYFKESQHELVEHEWLAHNDFLKLVKSMDLGMQVSYSETFNIVAADFVTQNIPIVMGEDIDWAHWLYKADPNNTNDIVAKLQIARMGKLLNLQKLNKIRLKKYNKNSLQEWINFLCKR